MVLVSQEMAKLKLSVVMITKNEIKNLKRSIESVKFADEIIIVDSLSTDGTEVLAESLGAKVIRHEFTGFADMKNKAVDAANLDWVLVLDADEEINEDLAEEIKRIVKNDGDGFTGWHLARKSSFLGKWMNFSGWFPDYTLRLFKNGKGRFKKARVHESLEIDGETSKINSKYFMNHYTYDSLDQYFSKFNFYTSLAALDLKEKNRVPSFAHIFIHPGFSFFKQYILKRGFRDGYHGFILAVFSSFYVFVKYLKLRFPDSESETK